MRGWLEINWGTTFELLNKMSGCSICWNEVWTTFSKVASLPLKYLICTPSIHALPQLECWKDPLLENWSQLFSDENERVTSRSQAAWEKRATFRMYIYFPVHFPWKWRKAPRLMQGLSVLFAFCEPLKDLRESKEALWHCLSDTEWTCWVTLSNLSFFLMKISL